MPELCAVCKLSTHQMARTCRLCKEFSVCFDCLRRGALQTDFVPTSCCAAHICKPCSRSTASCALCHKLFCSGCLSHVCFTCRNQRRCSVCIDMADAHSRYCKLCGQHFCMEHFDYSSTLCQPCQTLE